MATLFSSQLKADAATRPHTTPRSPPYHAPAITRIKVEIPTHKFTRAIAGNASRPISAPVCAPFIAPKITRPDPIASDSARLCAPSMCADRYLAAKIREPVISAPEIAATIEESARMRPARRGSLSRSSATYRVAVSPSPTPAKIPNTPAVL